MAQVPSLALKLPHAMDAAKKKKKKWGHAILFSSVPAKGQEQEGTGWLLGWGGEIHILTISE